MYRKSVSAQHTNFVNITFFTISQSKYKKSLAGKPLLVTKQPWWFCVKSGVDSSSIVSLESVDSSSIVNLGVDSSSIVNLGVDSSSIVNLESRIWQMDIYVVQWASIGPPREFF